MEEKNDDSFFQNKENYDILKRKLSGINNQNQSTEIIPSEDIFINQKEEIKKIKKKKLELKAFRENFKEKQNLKCIQIKKDKNCSVYNTLNTLSSHKSDNKKNEKNFGKKIKKSKSFTNKKLREKRNKSLNNNIKKIKLKLVDDFNVDNEINANENIETDKEEEEDTIFNNDSINNTIKNIENEIDFLSLSNIDYFEKCKCEFKGKDNNDNDENNLPIIEENWRNLSEYIVQNETPNLITNFDFSKISLITKNYIDYNLKGIEINIRLKLYSQSTFYIFTRCYIEDNNDTNNNTINNSKEIKKFKTENLCNIRNKKSKSLFSKYSTVIKIFKNRNSKKAFVSFGTFYKGKKSGNIHYKTFLQRQLVDYLHQDKNYYYLENDLCEFDIIVIDLGNENLEARISLNNKERFNNIKSNFYLPLSKKAKIMFCGEGKSAVITDLKMRSFSKFDEDKDQLGLILSTEKKSCDCCLIL
jgi:hypothetical protein